MNAVSIRPAKLKPSAGITGFAVELLNGDGAPLFFAHDWVLSHGYRAERLVAVSISGASMEPGLYAGDLVVINTADTEPRDGAVYALNYEGELAIKRLRRDAGAWWLTSDSLDKRRFPDKAFDENAILIGRVVYKQSESI